MNNPAGYRVHCGFPVRLGAAFLLFLAAACAAAAPINPRAAEISASPSNADTPIPPLPEATQPEAAYPPPGPAATVAPEESGFRLLVSTEQGLLMFHPDGSGRTEVIRRPVLSPGPLQNAVSPQGDSVAFIISSDLHYFVHNLGLQIMTLPSPRTVFYLKLTSPDTEPVPDPATGLLMGTRPYEINRAITEIPSFAWAPDGSHLAFIAACEGFSADLYTYRAADRAVTRLTDGTDQAYRPFWSPDGRFIVQTAADGFGTGAGYGITGIFATRIDRGVNFPLYKIPDRSGDELGLGWLDSKTLAVESWFASTGPTDLRLVNLATLEVTMIREGPVAAAAVAASGGTLVFSTGDGVYKVTLDSPAALKIGDESFEMLGWSEGAGVFYGRSADGVVYEITPDGNIQITPSKGLPIVSPDGRYWAWVPLYYFETESGGYAGVWAGERGKQQSQVFSGKVPNANAVAQLIWAPNSQSFYFADDQGNLFRTSVADWKPVLIASGLELTTRNLSLAWAGRLAS